MPKTFAALLRIAASRLSFVPQQPGGSASCQGPRPGWTRDRALSVLLPIAEGEASDSARVAAVAELNRMHGLDGPTLGQLVEAAQQPERNPWEGAI